MTIPVRAVILLSPIVVMAQDPYHVAGDHYHLVFENPWVRATRVTYGPHETAPVHRRPPTPTTVYVYVTDGAVMRFRHVTGEHVAGVDIDRKPVQAGAIPPRNTSGSSSEPSLSTARLATSGFHRSHWIRQGPPSRSSSKTGGSEYCECRALQTSAVPTRGIQPTRP
jgi:hypothetical protein